MTTDFANGDDDALEGAVLPDGRIVAFGTAGGVSANNIALAATRYDIFGTLDPGFSADGRAVVPNARDMWDTCDAGALDSSGRVLTGGMRWNYRTHTWVLARFKADGTADKTFNKSGVVTTQVYSKPKMETVTNIAVQPDNKIVAVGYSQLDAYGYPFRGAIVRYKDNGVLDTTFGSGGIVKPVLDGAVADSWRLNCLAVQSDGKIVVCGYASEWDRGTISILVMRLKTDGTLDSGFGGDGVVTVEADASLQRRGIDVKVQTDGKVLVGFDALYVDPATLKEARYPGIVRFNADGSRDDYFGAAGIVEADFPNRDVLDHTMGYLGGIEIVGNTVILAGQLEEFPGPRQAVLLAKYDLADGSLVGDFLDPDLDDDGVPDDDPLEEDPSLADYVGITIDWLGGTVVDMAVDPGTGNIVTFGTKTPASESDTDFFVTRYLSTGLPDTSFGP